MYIFSIGNQKLLYNRDEKRVGIYMEKERVPPPIRVSHYVRRISITKINNTPYTFKNNQLNTDKNILELFHDWLGNNVNILV